MEVIKDIANSIHDMIEFTVDVPSNYADGKMPVLDMKVWLNDISEIDFMFYEKSTKAQVVIGKDSALPRNIRM